MIRRITRATIFFTLWVTSVSALPPTANQPTVKIGKTIFRVEIARTDAEWSKGLMWRDFLAPLEGMLFVGKVQRPQTFWMKNTPISLDIIFISNDWKIVSIAKRTKPLSEDQIPSEGPAQHVLEIFAGQADMYHLKSGDRVEFLNIQ
jgi:uncharacterized membrane protein (UPF0127 family)